MFTSSIYITVGLIAFALLLGFSIWQNVRETQRSRQVAEELSKLLTKDGMDTSKVIAEMVGTIGTFNEHLAVGAKNLRDVQKANILLQQEFGQMKSRIQILEVEDDRKNHMIVVLVGGVELLKEQVVELGAKAKWEIPDYILELVDASREEAKNVYVLNSEKSVTLLNVMKKHVSLEALLEIVYTMGIDYDNLRGSTKVAKIIALLEYVTEHNRQTELLDICRKIYRNVNWPDF